MNSEVPFYTSDTAVEFLNEDSAAGVVEAIEQLAGFHGEPKLVIVDTLARNYGPGDENSTEDMSRFVSIIDRYLRHKLGCAVLIIHHSGLGDKSRARGASALKAALDWEYQMKAEGDNRKLTCTKSKDYEAPEPLTFKPKVVELGVQGNDIDGAESVTSLVLETTESTAIENRQPPKLTNAQQMVLDALDECLLDSDTGKIHIDEWRDRAYHKSISDSAAPDAKRKAFSRARGALLEKCRIETANDFYWLPVAGQK